MTRNSVQFSIAKHAQWAPGLDTDALWQAWLQKNDDIPANSDHMPVVSAMPAMLRRRARLLGRMALEVAYQCRGEMTEVPTIFCSQHGEVAHSIDLIKEQISSGGVSPIGFSSAVHNATAGLFSIARKDRSNHLALAAGAQTIECAVIEACSLLEDGASAVLLVSYEQALPEIFRDFEECREQAYAWAWLMVPANDAGSTQRPTVSLSWQPSGGAQGTDSLEPSGLQILRFYLGQQVSLKRDLQHMTWTWSRNDSAD